MPTPLLLASYVLLWLLLFGVAVSLVRMQQATQPGPALTCSLLTPNRAVRSLLAALSSCRFRLWTLALGLGRRQAAQNLPSGNSSVGRAPPCQGGGRRFESGFPLFRAGTGSGLSNRRASRSSPIFCRRRSQVVRQRSAKPPFGGSNPPGASRLTPGSERADPQISGD